MKIVLYVGILDQPGGAETATRRLAQGLAERGHSVTILTTQAISQWRKRASVIDYANSFRIVRLPVWQRSPRTFSSMLFAQAMCLFPLVLRDTQIIQFRGLNRDTSRLARIGRNLGIKTICVPMASGAYGDVATLPPYFAHNRYPFGWISSLTEPQRGEVVSWGFPVERMGVISNGVDSKLFKPPPHPIHEACVVFVGQFRPEKRVDLLLQAWVLVQRECPKATLTLVGGGNNLTEYKRLATQLGIAPTFVPNTDTGGVLAHLQANNIFVQSGISEGMSNALLEAMATGLAPIVSDTPANRAVITPEVDGVCYDAASSEALAAQLVRLITDASLRQRISAAARATVVQRFTLDSVIEQYLSLYTQLLGEKR